MYDPRGPHPFEPESRLYAELMDAGRIRREPAYSGSPTCQESRQVAANTFTRCGEPIVTSVPRDFPSSEPLYLCITHATRLWNSGERRMTLNCSVCGKTVKYPSQLDASGRSVECQP